MAAEYQLGLVDGCRIPTGSSGWLPNTNWVQRANMLTAEKVQDVDLDVEREGKMLP